MIDKSIRQHYEEGKKVNVIQEGIDKFTGNVKEKFFPQDDTGLDEKQLVKNVASSFLQRKLTTAAASKLAGTGILSSLGPIGMIIAAMLANKGIKYAKGKIKPDIKTALQSFQEGMIGSPKEQKELKGLEKRRANLIQRKDEGKTYSDKNLGTVTRAIAEAKGIDINNPNEMKNIDEDISRIYNKTMTPISKQDEEYAETGDLDVYSDTGTNTYTVPASEYSYAGSDEEDDALNYIIPTVENIQANEDNITQSPIYSNPNESAAAERAAITQAAAVKAEIDRQERNAAAEAAAKARAVVAPVYSSPARPHGGGGGNGGGSQGTSRSEPGGGIGGLGGHGPSRWAEGGRIDKPFTGRSRDI
jgi:hypothetical protein